MYLWLCSLVLRRWFLILCAILVYTYILDLTKINSPVLVTDMQIPQSCQIGFFGPKRCVMFWNLKKIIFQFLRLLFFQKWKITKIGKLFFHRFQSIGHLFGPKNPIWQPNVVNWYRAHPASQQTNRYQSIKNSIRQIDALEHLWPLSNHHFHDWIIHA